MAEKTRLLAAHRTWTDEADRIKDGEFGDERLELTFTCCGPALALDAQVALTLRGLGGWSMDARRSWCRCRRWRNDWSGGMRKITASGIPFRVPAVGCLIFNPGYTNPGRSGLGRDPARPGLVELMPDEAEPHGLLALMLLQARIRDGGVILLAVQERTLCDGSKITEGRRLFPRAPAINPAWSVRQPGRDRSAALSDGRNHRGSRPGRRPRPAR